MQYDSGKNHVQVTKTVGEDGLLKMDRVDGCSAYGLLLILLLMYFTLTNYVKPICRIADGINAYRSYGRRYSYTFDGDDQLSEINTGVTEIVDENVELKARIKSLREERNRTIEQ